MTTGRLGVRRGEAGLPPAGSWSSAGKLCGSPRGAQANAPWVAEEAVQPQSRQQPEDPAPPGPSAPVHHSSRDQAGIPGGRLCCLERLLDTESRPTGKPRPIGGPAPGRCRLVAVATPWAPISLALALPGNAAAIATAGRVQPSIGAGDALRQSGLQSPEPDPEEGPNHGPSRAGAVSRWVPGPTPERL